MTDIPQTEDMYYDVLAALGEHDSPVPYATVDDETIERLGLAGQFDADDERRLRERFGFARSGLKLIGAATNPQHGQWIITEAGTGYLDEDPLGGRRRLREDVGNAYATRGVDPAFLRQAREAADGTSPLELTVRELLQHWQYRRRGVWVNKQIRDDLASVGLTTDPAFASTWIDGKIRIVPAEPTVEGRGQAVQADHTMQGTGSVSAPVASEDTISLLVGSLESANREVVAVSPDDSLEKARSLMVLNDFSQLAVMSGPHNLKGYISWESIARARLRNHGAAWVRECYQDVETVKPNVHLLEVVPQIVKNGFVFVKSQDNRLAGIVTTADLSEQFVALANPFVLIGEIEQWLRRGLDAVFSQVELAEAADPDDAERDVTAAANLTLGEIKRLIENPANWERLGWSADRGVLVGALERSRGVRNSLMHFGPDPVEGDDLDHLRGFRNWLKELVIAAEGQAKS